jgi:hypothetical protein
MTFATWQALKGSGGLSVRLLARSLAAELRHIDLGIAFISLEGFATLLPYITGTDTPFRMPL